MKEILIDQKVTTFNYVLIQGEKNFSTLVFMPPVEFQGVNISALNWEIKAVNTKTDSFYITPLSGTIHEDRLKIPWNVDENFTGQDGGLCVTLIGRQNDEIRAKFQVEGINVKKECEAAEEMQPNYFESVIEKIQEDAQRAETAANEAENYSSHPPEILDNGNWGAWDGAAYEDTGKPSRGENGQDGQDGQDGRVYEVHAGTGVNVDNSDPANPVISATGAGGDMTKAVYDPADYNRQLAAETYPDLSTTDKSVPGAINELTAGKMDNFSYSENETWTGKYWTDGRKIYTKLVTGTVPSTGTTISIPHGVSGIGSFRAYDWVKMDNYQCPLFNFALPANNFNWLGFDETNLIFLRGGDGVWSGSPIVAAILYTKASDDPISI